MKRIVILLSALLAFGGDAVRAESQRLTVPLSDPNRPAELQVGLVMGSIYVVAGKAGEVVIEASAEDDDVDLDLECDDCPPIAGSADERDAKAGKRRLRRIPNSSFGVTAEEADNRVEIGSDSWRSPLELRIAVPPASSLNLSTVNEGEIEVTGVNGELELHNTNGDISVRDVAGPVSANTVNGDLTVTLSAAAARQAMAFSTLNGDVTLTLPAQASFDVRLRSDNGEIYSDFEIALTRRSPEVERDAGERRYRVSISKELTGKIGDGGPELLLRTFNGDLVLRKRGD